MRKKKKNGKKGHSLEEKKVKIDKILLGIYILILLFGFFKTYNTVFDKKISLGGDNVEYYILGNSIAKGYGYKNIHTKAVSEHNHFPPGYPLIIAGFSKVFSNDIIFIKKVNGFFLLLSLALLFLIIYRISSNIHWSFLTCLFSLYNFHLLNYSFIMMSEIPFLFFSLLSVWLAMKTDWEKLFYKSWSFWLLLLLLPFTYYIRSTGIALLLGIILFLLLKRKWKPSLVLFVGFFISVLPWYIRSKQIGGNAYINQLMRKNPYRPEMGLMEISDWVGRFWGNLQRYVTREIPHGMFNFVQQHTVKDPYTTQEWFLGIIIILIILFGLFCIKKYFRLILFYCGAYAGILLLWPSVWVGVRFVLPLIPLFIFFFLNGFSEILYFILNKIIKLKSRYVFQLVLVVVCFLSIQSYGKKVTAKLEKQAKGHYTKNYQNYFELARWVKAHGDPNSITCCRKGQLFFIYSTKFVNGFKNTLKEEEQIEYLKARNVTYVVVDQLGYSSTSRCLVPAVRKYPHKFKVIKHLKNPDTYLFEFHPELGYWGDWKDGKREGKGTFLWNDHKKFVGEWENNMRNGKGILYFPNGIRLEGRWINDELNGRAIYRDKNGVKLEEVIYENNVRKRIIYKKS